jgi:hypothetical protein
MMCEQVDPSAVAQRIIVTFLSNEDVKSAEILTRLRAQFDDETFLRTQLYDWSKSFKEGRTKVENMRRLHLLQGKLWPAFFFGGGDSFTSRFGGDIRRTMRNFVYKHGDCSNL